jgi:hypothetical protein
MSNEVNIKRVKPYPFPAAIDQGGAKVPVEVLLLTSRGFIARLTTAAIFHVGGSCRTEFELPVFKRQLASPLRVIKTYDRADKDHKVERLVEFHFESPGGDLTETITKFMQKIGQK